MVVVVVMVKCTKKAYSCIIPDDGGKDIYVHKYFIIGSTSLTPNEPVEYFIESKDNYAMVRAVNINGPGVLPIIGGGGGRDVGVGRWGGCDADRGWQWHWQRL